MKRGLSIGQQLAVGFLIVLAIVAAQFVVGAVWQQKVSATSEHRDQVVLPRANAARDLRLAILRMAIEIRSYTISSDPLRLTAFRASRAELDSALSTLDRLPHEDDGRARFDQLRAASLLYARRAEEFLETASRGSEPHLLAERERQISELRESVLRQADSFVALETEAAVRLLRSSRATEREQWLVVAGFGLLALAGVGIAAAVSTRRVRRPIETLLKATRALEGGDYEPAAALKRSLRAPRPELVNEIALMSHAFGDMAEKLQERSRTLRFNAELSSGMASTLELERLAELALRKMIDHARAQLGAVYVREADTQTLQRVAAFALDSAPPRCEIGNGIPGQVALAGEPLLVDDISEEAGFHVEFGFDRVAPRWVLAVPIPFQQSTGGVVVLGGLHALTSDEREFVERSAALLGVSVQNALSHRRVSQLAEELQARAEQLAAKNEQLQAQSEELQAQSEQLQAQSEELRAQGEELQAHNEHLIANAHRLAEADKRKDEFIAMLAHELRNPLGAISNAVHVLRKLDLEEPAFVRARQVLERQVRHQQRLLDDLLDTSRVARGKIELHRQAMDLGKLVSQAIEDHRMGLEVEGRCLTCELPPEPVWVDGDGERLAQVLGNLLSNARKFTRAGDRIKVRVAEDRARRQATVSVSDSGIGIDPAVLPRVFEVFAQSEAGLDRSRGGLGLGLALVHALVSLHGGSVSARSDGLGKGCEVSFNLPLGGQTGSSGSLREPGASTRAARRRSILIIEDNEDASATLRDLLELLGHQVAVAANGRDGLEAASRLQPEIVLCDLGLPGMDGFEVARRLRAQVERSGMKLVALSGYGQEGSTSRDAGFHLHLTKPVELGELQALLAE